MKKRIPYTVDCDWERCEECGGQRISCGCYEDKVMKFMPGFVQAVKNAIYEYEQQVYLSDNTHLVTAILNLNDYLRRAEEL